jgi:hypothetical protein
MKNREDGFVIVLNYFLKEYFTTIITGNVYLILDQQEKF